ncbi:MAG TPA: DNA repair protein RecO [Allosphingosinicella sp.]|jgi:DNA repair protein RecO (recombination protein O)
MRIETQAIVCAVRAHGEHGAIVRALTPADGIQAGYVRGGKSRRLRPVLVPGNIIQADYRARTDEQLAQLSVELVHSRAFLLSEPLAAAGIDWACALTAAALPEAQAYPRLYDAFDGLLSAIEAAPSARGWSAALVRYELLLLGELGFGLDLSECAATGARDDLAFVSPKSGRAVSRAGAGEYRDRLLALPNYLLGVRSGTPHWEDIRDGLKLTGHFLARDLLIERQADVLAARGRLVDRLQRMGA